MEVFRDGSNNQLIHQAHEQTTNKALARKENDRHFKEQVGIPNYLLKYTTSDVPIKLVLPHNKCTRTTFKYRVFFYTLGKNLFL